ncbi:MAG: Hsp20/alpha crystallin family protein [Patescibacteria group bacterium]|nr:Hsp20/alpha crystallin family protein [Patescibacteria group bacterium]
MPTPIIQQFGTPNEQETYFTPTEEGQLAVDVFEQGDNIIIRSTIAGVKPEDLDISVENDMITIRGRRHEEDMARGRNYFFQECYWGSFSRTIILPVHIKGDEAEAILKNGVLTIVIPRAHKTARVAVQGLDEVYE